MTPEQKVHELTVYIPDTRGVTISRFGKGNAKIGMDGVYTYSRLPGHPAARALGLSSNPDSGAVYLNATWLRGTCPGATAECQAICYAARPVTEMGMVFAMWWKNSTTETVPESLPPDAKIVRIHVSGDFTSPEYVRGWITLAADHPHVRFFSYTRSWRVATLLPWLEQLRTLKNVQLFASMDRSTEDYPSEGWRIAWIEGDDRILSDNVRRDRNHETLNRTFDGYMARGWSYTCPEETKHKPNCQACRYCIDGQQGDVTFLKH